MGIKCILYDDLDRYESKILPLFLDHKLIKGYDKTYHATFGIWETTVIRETGVSYSHVFSGDGEHLSKSYEELIAEY